MNDGISFFAASWLMHSKFHCCVSAMFLIRNLSYSFNDTKRSVLLPRHTLHSNEHFLFVVERDDKKLLILSSASFLSIGQRGRFPFKQHCVSLLSIKWRKMFDLNMPEKQASLTDCTGHHRKKTVSKNCFYCKVSSLSFNTTLYGTLRKEVGSVH